MQQQNLFPISKETIKSFIKEAPFKGYVGEKTTRNFEDNFLEEFTNYLNSRKKHWTPEKLQKLIFAIELGRYAEAYYHSKNFPIYYDNAVYYTNGLIIQMQNEEN